jgi:CBS domain-containing protein
MRERIRDVMTKDPACSTPDTTIEEAARMMVDHDCGAIPVVGDPIARMPLGIITDRDIVTRTIAKGRDPMGLTVRDCMTSPAVTVVDDALLHECVDLLELSQIRRVIVVDASGACVGIVAQADIARHASKRETGELVREVSKPAAPTLASTFAS